MNLLSPAKPLDPLPDISGKVVSIIDLAIHARHRQAFLAMIQQLLEFIRAEQGRLSPEAEC
jgi:quinol monooxygenase YgiN